MVGEVEPYSPHVPPFPQPMVRKKQKPTQDGPVSPLAAQRSDTIFPIDWATKLERWIVAAHKKHLFFFVARCRGYEALVVVTWTALLKT